MTEKKARSGTDKTRKEDFIGFRVDPVEYAEIKTLADDAGMSVSSFVRLNALQNVKTISRFAPTLDRVLLSKLLGEAGKIGSNINQIARRLNEGGGVGAERITALCDDFIYLRTEILKAIRALDDNKGQIKSRCNTGGELSL